MEGNSWRGSSRLWTWSGYGSNKVSCSSESGADLAIIAGMVAYELALSGSVEDHSSSGSMAFIMGSSQGYLAVL